MAGSYRSDPDDRGVSEVTTFSSLTKVDAVSTDRENKIPRYNNDGTTSIVSNSNFNSKPSKYGKIPEDWLMRQRHNPCLHANKAAAYYDARYIRTGQLIGTTGLDSSITSWDNHPANASQISISSIASGGSRYFYASYVTTFPFSRTLIVQPESSDAPEYGTYYDPSIQTIWPMILFGGSPATVNWEGLAPRDADQPSSHPTTTALEVDGVSIPAGTSWNLGGSVGNLSISTRWFVKGKRDL